MPFDTLSPRLQDVAIRALAHCRGRYGNNGVKIEEGIADAIMWRPTFLLKPSRFRMIAVEVEDNLYPQSLKGAAHEISHFDFPIQVFQACSLEAYQSDPRHLKINQLKDHGFGIITVDEAGLVVVQHTCVPLAQHISPQHFEREISGLSNVVKVAFRSAYDVYITNEGQGLQDTGQILEGIIESMWAQLVKAGTIQAGNPNRPLAHRIDDLYAANVAIPHRAALGGARGFVQEFRNTASHPPRTAQQAAEKIRRCRVGFLEAISLARKLRVVCQALGLRTKIFVT